jgi:RNA polymerase sigma-70 factor (ECF subfamily)
MAPAALAVVRQGKEAGERLLHAFAEALPELSQALGRFLASPEDAQDALQDAFLKCWRRRDRLDEVRNLRAWIFRVAFNAARDLQRNVWRRRACSLSDHPEELGQPALSPNDEALRAEDVDRVHSALRGLRAEERAVFLLRQNTALTYEEIAQRRRLPVGTVKTQMRAALHKLRAVLHERA